MKFNRTALRDAASAALDAERQEHADRTAAERAEFERTVAGWLDDHGDAWHAAAKAITAKLRKGQPVIEADLPASGRGCYRPALFRARPQQLGEYRPNAELVALVAALDVVADDTVTSSGLQAVGMTRAAIQRAVGHLAAGQVTR